MTSLVDFAYLTGFHFEWTCLRCGATGIAAGPGTTWRAAQTHAGGCHE